MQSEAARKDFEFIDNGNAPEFFANGLHEVEVMGSVSRFVLFVLKRSAGGVFYREPCLTWVLPNEAIAPAVMLTVERTGIRPILPVAANDEQALLMRH